MSYFPAWEPGVWTGACITASRAQTFIRVNVNGVTVAGTERYRGYYQDIEQNIILMNNLYWVEPNHGALTDVNIWSRVFSGQEMADWTICKSDLVGDVLSWEEAELNI